jgi:hypothetical protein
VREHYTRHLYPFMRIHSADVDKLDIFSPCSERRPLRRIPMGWRWFILAIRRRGRRREHLYCFCSAAIRFSFVQWKCLWRISMWAIRLLHILRCKSTSRRPMLQAPSVALVYLSSSQPRFHRDVPQHLHPIFEF